MSFITKSGKNAGRAAVVAKDWVVKNPKTATGVVVAPAVAVVAAPLALGAAGFTAGGVAAGSVAAGVQAGIGNVVGGSVFAILQGAGAGGAALGLVQGVAGGAAAVAAGGAAYVFRKGNEQENTEKAETLQDSNHKNMELEDETTAANKADAKL